MPLRPNRSSSCCANRSPRQRLRKCIPFFADPVSDRFIFLFDEINIRVRNDADAAEIKTFLAKRGLRVMAHDEFAPNVWLLRADETPGEEILALANELARDTSRFSWAEPNFHAEMTKYLSPDDPFFPNQWHLENNGQNGAVAGADVSAEQAWAFTLGDPNVVIAVLDDGLDLGHPDLAQNLWANSAELNNGLDDDGNSFIDDLNGWDFCDDDNDPGHKHDLTEGHGTAVAGIAAAVQNNGLGVSGIAPNCKLLPLKIFDGDDYCGDFSTGQAIRYAAQYAAVINCSWGGGGASSALEDAIIFARTQGRNGKGSLILCASGNDGISPISYPARYPWCVGVGASNSSDFRSSFSNYGIGLSLLAPSGNWTTDMTGLGRGFDDGEGTGNYTAIFGGTSSATPLAVGAAALLISLDADLTADQVAAALQQTADLIQPNSAEYDHWGHSRKYGFGRLNAAQALALTDSEGALLDDFLEENDTRDEATSLSLGQYKSLVALDEDWYMVDVPAETEFSASIQFPHELHNLDLELYNEAGQLVDDSRTSGSPETVSTNTAAIPKSQRFYLRIFSPGAYYGHGYALESTVRLPDDEYEDNDTLETAALIGLGNHLGLQAYDDDYFQVNVIPGRGLEVTISFLSELGDLDLEVYDEQGAILGASVSINDVESLALYAGAANAKYFVRVYGYESATNSYVLTLDDVVPPQEDAHEENDTAETAAEIVAGSYQLASLDDDWFRVSVPAGSSVTVRLELIHELGDLDTDLFDQNLSLIDSSLTAGNLEFLHSDGLVGNVAFFIKVYGFLGAINNYTMTVEVDCTGPFTCFVDNLYWDFLGREADVFGRQYYLDRLCQGELSPAQIAGAFWASSELEEEGGFVARCYFGLLNDNFANDWWSLNYRLPDFPGVMFWRSIQRDFSDLGDGSTDPRLGQLAVVAGFLASAELHSRLGKDMITESTDEEFVAFLYRNILGREPDAPAFGDYVQQLGLGWISRVEMTLNFIESFEAREKYRWRTAVAWGYLGAMARTPDRFGFLHHMEHEALNKSDLSQLAANFIYSPEYSARLLALGCLAIIN